MASTVIIYSKGDAFGDGLLRIPMLRAARTAFPEARIVYGSTKGSSLAGPLRVHVEDLVDEIRTAATLARIARDERSRGAGLLVADLRSSPLEVLADRLRLAGGVIGYEANLPGYALALARGRIAVRPEHNAWRFHRLIERLAGRTLPFDHRLEPDADARALAQDIRGESGRPVMLICGNHFERKTMSVEQAAAVASALIADGFHVIYLESPGPGLSTGQLTALEPRIAVVGQGYGLPPAKLDALFLALGESAVAYIGMEGGMAHLMATVMAPIVLLNAGADIERWRPLSGVVEVVASGGRVADIAPAAIVAATHRLLDAQRRNHGARGG